MESQARGAGIEHAAQAVRAAIEEHRMARALDGSSAAALGREYLFGNDLDEPLNVLGIQHVVRG